MGSGSGVFGGMDVKGESESRKACRCCAGGAWSHPSGICEEVVGLSCRHVSVDYARPRSCGDSDMSCLETKGACRLLASRSDIKTTMWTNRHFMLVWHFRNFSQAGDGIRA